MTRIDLAGASLRLAAVRQSEGLTKSEFADILGVDRSTYIKIENGEREVRVALGLAVASLFGVSLDFLYRGDWGSLTASQAAKIRPHLPRDMGGSEPEQGREPV